jgi:hypothetical protein
VAQGHLEIHLEIQGSVAHLGLQRLVNKAALLPLERLVLNSQRRQELQAHFLLEIIQLIQPVQALNLRLFNLVNLRNQIQFQVAHLLDQQAVHQHRRHPPLAHCLVRIRPLPLVRTRHLPLVQTLHLRSGQLLRHLRLGQALHQPLGQTRRHYSVQLHPVPLPLDQVGVECLEVKLNNRQISLALLQHQHQPRLLDLDLINQATHLPLVLVYLDLDNSSNNNKLPHQHLLLGPQIIVLRVHLFNLGKLLSRQQILTLAEETRSPCLGLLLEVRCLRWVRQVQHLGAEIWEDLVDIDERIKLWSISMFVASAPCKQDFLRHNLNHKMLMLN